MGGQEGIEECFKTKYLNALALYRLIQSKKFREAYKKNQDPNVYKMVTIVEVTDWITKQLANDITAQPTKVLRAKAAGLRIDRYWSMDKDELIEAITHATSSSEQTRSTSN
jgi:hypothetical protein